MLPSRFACARSAITAVRLSVLSGHAGCVASCAETRPANDREATATVAMKIWLEVIMGSWVGAVLRDRSHQRSQCSREPSAAQCVCAHASATRLGGRRAGGPLGPHPGDP